VSSNGRSKGGHLPPNEGEGSRRLSFSGGEKERGWIHSPENGAKSPVSERGKPMAGKGNDSAEREKTFLYKCGEF